MTTTDTTTPMFEHPLHTLLTDLGFADGDATFDITDTNDPTLNRMRAEDSCDMTFDVINEDNHGPYATLCSPAGFMLGVQLPDNPYPARQLQTILYGLQALSRDTYDLDDAAETFTACGDNLQENRDRLAMTHMWAEMQVDRILDTGYALCDLMSIDPTTMPTSEFLPALWRYASHSQSPILFTLLDEHLNAIGHPFTRRPDAK